MKKNLKIQDFFRPKSASDAIKDCNAETKRKTKSPGTSLECSSAKSSGDAPTRVAAVHQSSTENTSPTETLKSGSRKIRFVSKRMADLQVDIAEEKSFPIPFHKFIEYTNVLDLVDMQIRTARQHSYQDFVNNMSYVQKIARRCYLDFYMRPKSRKKYPLRNLTVTQDCPKQVRSHVMEIPEKYQRHHSKKSRKVEDNALQDEIVAVTESHEAQVAIENEKRSTETRKRPDSINPNAFDKNSGSSNLITLTASSNYQPPSFKTFKKFVNFDEELNERICRCTEEITPNNESAVRAKLELEFYKDFYAALTVRQRLKWKLRPCPRRIREQILTHMPLADEIPPNPKPKNAEIVQSAERLANGSSNDKNSADFHYPVSFELFKKYTNQNEIVDEILQGVVLSKEDAVDENLRERVFKNYYKAFYLAPEIREKFKVKLKPCPSKMKTRLLYVPTITRYSNKPKINLMQAHKRSPSPRKTHLSPQAKKQKTVDETPDQPLEATTDNLTSHDENSEEVEVKTINARDCRLFMDYFNMKSLLFGEEMQSHMRECFILQVTNSTDNSNSTHPVEIPPTISETSQVQSKIAEPESYKPKRRERRRMSKVKLRRLNISSPSTSSLSSSSSSEDNCSSYVLSTANDSDETDVNSELERGTTSSIQMESQKEFPERRITRSFQMESQKVSPEKRITRSLQMESQKVSPERIITRSFQMESQNDAQERTTSRSVEMETQKDFQERQIARSFQMESKGILSKNSNQNHGTAVESSEKKDEEESLSVRDKEDLAQLVKTATKDNPKKSKQKNSSKKLQTASKTDGFISNDDSDSEATAVNSELNEIISERNNYGDQPKLQQEASISSEVSNERVVNEELISSEPCISAQKGSMNSEVPEEIVIVKENTKIVGKDMVEPEKPFKMKSQNEDQMRAVTQNLPQTSAMNLEDSEEMPVEGEQSKAIDEIIIESEKSLTTTSENKQKIDQGKHVEQESCLKQVQEVTDFPSNAITSERSANKNEENHETPSNAGSSRCVEALEFSQPCDNHSMSAESSESVHSMEDDSSESTCIPDSILNDTFFRKVKKNYTLAYAVRRSRGLKRRILLAILKMSLFEFTKYTRLYQRPQFHENTLVLCKAYEFVIKKDQIWHPELYMTLSDMLLYLETKSITFSDGDLNLQYFSPKLFHLEELANLTDLDKIVEYDYFKETAKTLDPSKLTERRQSYYLRCWAEDEWIWRVPSLVEHWPLIDIGKDCVNISRLATPPLDVIMFTQTQAIEMTEMLDKQADQILSEKAIEYIKTQELIINSHSIESLSCKVSSMINHYMEGLVKTEDDIETEIFANEISKGFLRNSFKSTECSQSQEIKNAIEYNEIKTESITAGSDEETIHFPNKNLPQFPTELTSTLTQASCINFVENNRIPLNTAQTIIATAADINQDSNETNQSQKNSTNMLPLTTERTILPLSPNIFASSSGSMTSQQLHQSTIPSSSSAQSSSNSTLNMTKIAISSQDKVMYINMPCTQKQIESLPMDEVLCNDPLYEETMVEETNHRQNANLNEIGVPLSPNPQKLYTSNNDENSLKTSLENKDAQNVTPQRIIDGIQIDADKNESNSKTSDSQDPLLNENSTSFNQIGDIKLKTSLMDESGVVPVSVKKEIMKNNAERVSTNFQEKSLSNFTTIVIDDSDDEAAASNQSIKSDDDSIEIKKEPKFLNHLQFCLDESNGSMQVHKLEPTEIIIDDEDDDGARTNETTSNLIDELMNPTATKSTTEVTLSGISSSLSNDTTNALNEAQRLPSSLEEMMKNTQASLTNAELKNYDDILSVSSDGAELLLESIIETVLVEADDVLEEQQCKQKHSELEANRKKLEDAVNFEGKKRSEDINNKVTTSSTVRTTQLPTEPKQISLCKLDQQKVAKIKSKRSTAENKNSHLVPQRTHAFRSLPSKNC